MPKQLRTALNAASKVWAGFALAMLVLAPEISLTLVGLMLASVVLNFCTEPLPDNPIERELMLEREIENLKQQGILDKLAIDALKQSLDTAIHANDALQKQFAAWASQAELQGVILQGASKRLIV